jgi:transcriptional antiterminator RfaH
MSAEPLETSAEDPDPSCTDASTGCVEAAPPDPMNPPDPLEPPGVGESWAVLYTRSRREKQVAHACTFLGVRHYLPLREHWTGLTRRRVYEVPLFPSYVFACLPDGTRVEILRTGGIAKVIAVSHPEILLAELREIRAARAAGANLQPGLAFPRGVRVRVISGPLAGIEGRVADLRRRRSREWLVLNVSFLGQAAVTEIAPWDVERVRSPIERNEAA